MSPSVTRDIPLGTILRDTYEIVGVLGRGGMGTVFLANHLRLPGRQVAIKVLRNDAGLGKEVFVRFRREAEIASRLGHPNIVEVLDFDHLKDGSPFLVMECLRGQPLSRRLRRGTLTLEDVLSIARQMGSALQATHRAGIVHRDLKPGNVFLVPTEVGGVAMEQVKLLDFGISKVIDSQSVNTQGGILLGTPQYMAPEQAQGKNQEVDPRTDIFSFGCMVYEMLARRLPFKDGPLPELIYRIVYDPPDRLDTLVSGVPEHVVAAIDRALEKRPEDRYPDVGSFILDLTGIPLQSLAPDLSPMMPAMSVRPSQIETLGPKGQPVHAESVSSKSETVSYRRSGEEDRSAKRPVVNVQLHEVSTLSEGETPGDGSQPRPDAAAPPPPPGITTRPQRRKLGGAQGAAPSLKTGRSWNRWGMLAAVVVLVGAVAVAVGLRLGVIGGTRVVPGTGAQGAGGPESAPPTLTVPSQPVPGTTLVEGPGSGTAPEPAESPGLAQAQPADAGTAQVEPAQNGAAQAQPAQNGTAQVQPPDAGGAQAQPAQNGTAQVQPPDAGTTQAQPSQNGLAQAQPADAGTSPLKPPETSVAVNTPSPGPATTVIKGRTPAPRPSPKGSSSAIPEAALADLVAAERALSRGDADEALHLVRRSQRVQVTGTSFSLLTRAHCRQKDLSNALTAWERVPAWERNKVRRYCKQYDISL
nr:serine/threonine-protein kinase [Pyxidicoccus trucidator]